MNKLTLVSFQCRGKAVTAFVYGKFENGKLYISPKIIDNLFFDFYGFVPSRGETISHL